ncbi:MAG: ribosome hibernation-promoting factor, HPF/YfiA family [Chloroflexota bacterium]
MQVVVKGKNMEVSEKLRQFVESKILKLERILPEIAEADVEITSAKTKSANHRYVVQVTLKANGSLIRGEQAADDSYTAMDAVLDKLDRQLARYKTKRFGAYNKGGSEARATITEPPMEPEPIEEGRLVRTKRFAMKPMDVEEALMQMELLGHNFYVFNNVESGRVSVVYRRQDGDFGLIEPE